MPFDILQAIFSRPSPALLMLFVEEKKKSNLFSLVMSSSPRQCSIRLALNHFRVDRPHGNVEINIVLSLVLCEIELK